MATLQELEDQLNKAQQANLLPSEKNNTVSTFQSILAGIGSGLIEIPKGVYHRIKRGSDDLKVKIEFYD